MLFSEVYLQFCHFIITYMKYTYTSNCIFVSLILCSLCDTILRIASNYKAPDITSILHIDDVKTITRSYLQNQTQTQTKIIFPVILQYRVSIV